jgi:hypothetical protein
VSRIEKKSNSDSSTGLTLSFNVGIANRCGVNAAIVYNHILFWLTVNFSKQAGFVEGKTWMYESQEDMANYFKFMSEKEVRNAIKVLLDEKLIEKSHFHDDKWKKTNWYTVTDQSLIGFQKVYSKRPQGRIDTAPPGASKSPAGLIYNKDKDKQRRETNINTLPPKVDKEPVIFLSFGSKVKLKDEDYKKLCADHGKESIDSVIDSINDWEVANGKKGYKCYAAAIRQWLKREKAQPAKPIPTKYPPKKEDWCKINQAHAEAFCKDKPWMKVDNYYCENRKVTDSRYKEIDMRLHEPESFPQRLEALARRG